MKNFFPVISLIILLSTQSHAFFDDLKGAVEQGTLHMDEKGNGIYDSAFQCPPFATQPEAEEIWKKQVAEFCTGEFNITELRYEKNELSADAIYATIECVEQVSKVSVENKAGETEKVEEPAPVVAIQPEKTKKVLDKGPPAGSSQPSSSQEPNEEGSTLETPEKAEPSPEVQEYLAKLDSYDPEIFRNGAKEIYYKNLNDPVILDAVEKTLLSTFRLDKGKVHTDGMGWLCKVLGGTSQRKYIRTLDKIATSGATFKLRWHAALQRDKLVKLGDVTPKSEEQRKLDIEQKLVELKELYDQGLITESEYSEKKANLLKQL